MRAAEHSVYRLADGPGGPVVPFLRPAEAIACPIKSSLGLLGRRWTLVIVRDLAFLPDPTFGQILRKNPGLTPRVLSARLRELREEGLLEKLADARDERRFHYRLTSAGKDVVPVLTALISFGMLHQSGRVFVDGRPRTMEQTFPGQARVFLGRLYDYARAPGARR